MNEELLSLLDADCQLQKIIMDFGSYKNRVLVQLLKSARQELSEIFYEAYEAQEKAKENK